MRRESTEKTTGLRLAEAHHRLALWTALFAIVALAAALGLSRSAQAAPAPGGPGYGAIGGLPTTLVAAPEEDEEEEFEAEEDGGKASAAECAAEAQEEIEEGEPVETECEAEEAEEAESEEAPEECFVRTSTATIAANPGNDTVRLAVKYTTWSPAAVAVSYHLLGGKGGLALGHATKHFGKQGVLKLTAQLTDSEMAKVEAAHEFDVSVHAVNTPAYCGKLFAERLSTHKTLGKGRLWTDPRAG